MRYVIYINNDKTIVASNNNPNIKYNVRVYVSNNWDPAANVLIKEVSIDTEDDDNKLTEWKKVYSQQNRNYQAQWQANQCTLNDCDEIFDGATNKNYMRLGHIVDQTTEFKRNILLFIIQGVTR